MAADSQQQRTVVIVGAGMAGLMCAREILLRDGRIRVIIVEADQQVGGRIKANDNGVDIGAEYIHCRGTVLTNLIDEYREKGVWGEQGKQQDFLVECFVTAHADGGPSDGPTRDGKHGMYYIDGKLLMYNDQSLHKLNHALEEIFEGPIHPNDSVEDALGKYQLSPSLMALADGGYANTAGGPMKTLSLSMLAKFEKYWEEHEIEGDFHMPLNVGMYGVVKALQQELLQFANLEIKLRTKVTRIAQQPENKKVTVTTGAGGVSLVCDAAVVTVAPPIYQELDIVDLPDTKRKALSMVGFEPLMKVCLCVSRCLWPELCQSVVCSDQPIPELWFRETGDSTFHVVGYLASTAAVEFKRNIRDENGEASRDKATDMFIQQLAVVFGVPEQDWHEALLDAHMCDWADNEFVKGGYMSPLVGMSPEHLEALAAPVGQIFFAGEATNTNACCTIQAAMETGIRAAKEVLQSFES